MSVVTVLSIVLAMGFLAVGLVGFLGWRERMAPVVVDLRHSRNSQSRPGH
jgi:hypothetical protein